MNISIKTHTTATSKTRADKPNNIPENAGCDFWIAEATIDIAKSNKIAMFLYNFG